MKIDNVLKKIKEKIQQLYKKNKKLFFITVAVISILLSLFLIPKKDKDINGLELNSDNLMSSSYSQKLERKIESMLIKISSINKVNVLIMVDSSPTTNYLTQKESTKTTGSSGESLVEKEEIVYEKSGSTQKPVEISTTYSKITGVLIVINQIDASTKISLQNAVAGVLNISSDSIFILQDR